MDFMEFMLKGALAAREEKVKQMLQTPALAVLTEEEAKRYSDIMARKEALEKGTKRACAKLDFDKKRWWMDMEQKYNLIGVSLHFDAATKSLYEDPD